MKKATYPLPGLLVAVPLQRGGFGVAIVARSVCIHRRNVRLILVYGFDRVFHHVPPLTEARRLCIFDAVHVLTCGDASIRDGRWPTIGKMDPFDLTDWPVPPKIQPISSPQNLRKQIPDPLVRKIYITESEYLSGDLVSNDGLIDPQHEECFPYSFGIGDSALLEGTLDRAIRDRSRLHCVKITPNAVALWQSTIEEAKRRGVFPQAKDWTKPTRKRAAKRREKN